MIVKRMRTGAGARAGGRMAAARLRAGGHVPVVGGRVRRVE